MIWGRSSSMCFLGCWPSHPRKCVSFWSCLCVIVGEPKNWNISDQILHRYIWHFLTLPSRNKSCSIKTSKPSLFFVKTSGGFCKLATQSFFKLLFSRPKWFFAQLSSQPDYSAYFTTRKETDMLFNKYALVECFSHTWHYVANRDLDFPPWYKSYKTINILDSDDMDNSPCCCWENGTWWIKQSCHSGNLHSFQITRRIHMAPAKGAPAGADPNGSSMFLYR